MKTISLSAAIALLALTLGVIPAAAQSSEKFSSCISQAVTKRDLNQITALSRAKNLARQAAESANGGLASYHAETSMHGPVGQAPCVDNGNGTWTFTFKGGEPGFTTPTVESVVLVDPSNWNVVVEYNGPVR